MHATTIRGMASIQINTVHVHMHLATTRGAASIRINMVHCIT